MELNDTAASSSVRMPTVAGYFMSTQCYHSLFIQLDLFNLPCLQLIFSRLLGYVIIAVSSTFMKLPQIAKILKNESAKGVSFPSQMLMLMTSSIAVTYAVARNYPINLWGESIALSLQTLVVGLLILIYEGHPRLAVLYTIIYVIIMVILLSPLIPLSVHIQLQVAAVPLGSLSKIIQILTNYFQGSTGQLSAIYIFLTNFRSFGRLLTLVIETGDLLQNTYFSIKSSLNVVSLLQIIYYQRKSNKTQEESVSTAKTDGALKSD